MEEPKPIVVRPDDGTMALVQQGLALLEHHAETDRIVAIEKVKLDTESLVTFRRLGFAVLALATVAVVAVALLDAFGKTSAGTVDTIKTLVIVLLATPRSQYWRYSEQTLATGHRSRPAVPADSDLLATVTLSKAVSATS